MTTIFLTGATGNMGREGMKQLLNSNKRFKITVLVLPSERKEAVVKAWEANELVSVVYGDLTNYNDVEKCVKGANIVLHVGGMVSPKADYFPELTTRINIQAAENITRAILAQPEKDQIKLVYIGTVAQTGDRNPPIHWGRAGDPIIISYYDNYARSKTIAERIIIESGIKYWVSLRQTGILHQHLLKNLDPIMFHQPLNGVFEWVSAYDSGVLLANICRTDLPESFWCRVYNIGGGEKFRVMNWEFIQRISVLLGVKDIRKVWEPNWFATQNFHGQWFTDSDRLEQYLQFRSGSFLCPGLVVSAG
ncbi:MAG: NAD(P)-dependent oxidoreductase [Bacteroidia bacterium]|nr:NAD(P)-dependent oxidoreductase [Bacteroidia bacterium]